MLNKDEFIEFILKGPKPGSGVASKPEASALPEGFEGFGFDTDEPTSSGDEANASFARRLLEASGFGYAELVQRDSVIRSSDAVARYLPARAAYWPKTAARPYQTLLFEADLNHKELLAIPAFRHQKMFHLDIVEDALSRFVEEALKGFQQGGQGVTADVRQGRREETLCVISILDERDGDPVRLVCFGTQNQQTGGLETFRITEQTRFWEPQIARDHLGLLYERQFKKLTRPRWQEAFTTTEERMQAKRLLEICTGAPPTEHDIQEGVLTLLDTIAKGFGLHRRPGQQRRLQAFALPPDHDIGIDPEEREAQHSGRNPFGGVALRDERNRLLGYIIYPLKTKTDADRLRTYLQENNRFHNVLVVYPGADQAALELWQGREQLTGKLRKGQGYRDAAEVVNLLSRFFVVSKAKVRNPAELAQELAYRARYLRRLAVKQLEEEPETGHLRELYNAFKEALVHDQTEEEFADAYAQTLTYGLLSARWVSKDKYVASGERFTRESALKHMPATSPFLREFFETVLKASFEFKLTWLLDDIADLLDRIDIDTIFNRDTQATDWTTDPVIYFYEPFLQAYDPQIRRARGVYYTPRPVVSYIVRSVDELLRTEFGLVDGLADTTTWGEMVKRHEGIKIPDGAKPEDSFVQILDPAAGTGTFLVEVIDVIHKTLTRKWQGEGQDGKKTALLWNDYVPKRLLPRLHGYELLMAPYVIAHMKIGLKLYETGHRFGNDERVRVYLTNALEPAQDFSDRLAFAIPALAHEAKAVSKIKRDQRFTVVTGNPPYAISSLNQGPWIVDLLIFLVVTDSVDGLKWGCMPPPIARC